MSDPLALLVALQFADGQFPGGGFAFSGGLETLLREARLHRAEVCDFIVEALDRRWGPCDRVAVGAAHALACDVERLHEIDAQLEALSWPAAMREGSRQAGAALLAGATRLGIDGADSLARAVAQGRLAGHAPLVQGVVLRGAGLDAPTALASAGYRFVTGLTSAAVRLGALGALEAQRVMIRARPRLLGWMQQPVNPPYHCGAFSPEAEIAMMRHARSESRLFVN